MWRKRLNASRDIASGPKAEQRVVRAIVEAIQDLQLAPGARLVERELALKSGASRSAIRNGFLRLAQSGLVQLNLNKGATIATCGPREAREIFDARVVLESSLIKDLARKLSQKDSARLEAFVEDERQAYAAGRMQDARRLSRGFHLLLAEIAGNRVLAGFLRELINKQPLLSWSRNGATSCFCGNQAHSQIVRAIACGDAETAVALNIAHLRELERELIAERADVSGVRPSAKEEPPDQLAEAEVGKRRSRHQHDGRLSPREIAALRGSRSAAKRSGVRNEEI